MEDEQVYGADTPDRYIRMRVSIQSLRRACAALAEMRDRLARDLERALHKGDEARATSVRIELHAADCVLKAFRQVCALVEVGGDETS